MASATSGGVAFDVAVEAVTSGDALDLDATTSFDTVNGGSDAAVPGTAGYMEQISITLSNLDSAAAGDLVRISLARDVADAADTAAGDCYVLAVEIRDGA
jgi:K+-transporting ATPase A subunit